MSDYEHKEHKKSIYYGESVVSMLFGKFPKDIKLGSKKSGRMRKALRGSLLFRFQRQHTLSMQRTLARALSENALFHFKDRVSLHKRRKISRGFVSNRKSDGDGVRAEWKTLNDTKDK